LMARELRSPIARVDSQAISRLRNETALAKPLGERIDGCEREVQALGAIRIAREHQLIPRQCLPLDNLAYVVCKMLEWGEAAGLGMEMHKIETPAALLSTAMLAHEAVKP